MGEMTVGDGVPERRRGRARARLILRLLLAAAVCMLLALGWAWYGVYYSGRLALAQQAPAGEALRGFDFGPVWLEQGQVGRYYITATLPQTEQASWRTSFEVLDANRQPVFREDEVRFIGAYMFQPGQRESSHHQFTLQKGTGYYYFRFKAFGGVYDANLAAPPVVEFAMRQRVLYGWSLWTPVAGLLILGLLLLWWAIMLVNRMGEAGAEAVQREAVAGMPKAIAEPPAVPAFVRRAQARRRAAARSTSELSPAGRRN